MCPTTRACAMVILSVLWGHSSRARRLLCLHGIICRCNVTRCPSLGAHCTSSERQSEACPGLTGPPAVPTVRWRSSDSMPLSSALYGCPWGPFGASWEARGDVATSSLSAERLSVV